MLNSNVVKLVQPSIFSDQLTEVLRRGARYLLAQAVEAEVSDFLRLVCMSISRPWTGTNT